MWGFPAGTIGGFAGYWNSLHANERHGTNLIQRNQKSEVEKSKSSVVHFPNTASRNRQLFLRVIGKQWIHPLCNNTDVIFSCALAQSSDLLDASHTFNAMFADFCMLSWHQFFGRTHRCEVFLDYLLMIKTVFSLAPQNKCLELPAFIYLYYFSYCQGKYGQLANVLCLQ